MAVNFFDHFRETPNMIGDSGFHRRSDAQRLVNPAEIVVHEVRRDGMLVALNLETSKADRLEPLRNWILGANEATQWVAEENWSKMSHFCYGSARSAFYAPKPSPFLSKNLGIT